MSHHLDQAHRRADCVSALCLARHGKHPTQLDPALLRRAMADVDTTLAVVDVIRCYDARPGAGAPGPSFARIGAVMAGEDAIRRAFE